MIVLLMPYTQATSVSLGRHQMPSHRGRWSEHLPLSPADTDTDLMLLLRSSKPDGETPVGGTAPGISALSPPPAEQHSQAAHRVHAQSSFTRLSAER